MLLPQSQLNYTCTLRLSPCPSMSELRNRTVLLLRFMVPSQQLQAAVQISCWPHVRSSSLLPQVRKSEIGSQISGPSSSVGEGRRRELREKRERGRKELRERGGEEILLIALTDNRNKKWAEMQKEDFWQVHEKSCGNKLSCCAASFRYRPPWKCCTSLKWLSPARLMQFSWDCLEYWFHSLFPRISRQLLVLATSLTFEPSGYSVQR